MGLARFFIREGADRPSVTILLVCINADGKVGLFDTLHPHSAVGAELQQLIDEGVVTGKGVSSIHKRPPHRGGWLRIIPLGKRSSITPDVLRDAAAQACADQRNQPGLGADACIHIGDVSFKWRGKQFTQAEVVGLLNLGWNLRNGTVQRVPELIEETAVNPLSFWLATSTDTSPEVLEAVRVTDQMSLNAQWVRRVGNMRSNECTPTVFMDEAKQLIDSITLTRDGATVETHVLDQAFYEGKTGIDGLTKPRECGGVMSVTQGSPEAPAGILSIYRCGLKNAKAFVIIGKGVTFDSGGMNLKPDNHMLLMYGDKMGLVNAVAMYAYFMWIGVPFDMVLVGNAVENIAAPTSTRPSMMITLRDGRKIEINNTDAEGRLILADAIHIALEVCKALGLNLKKLRVFATLTGHSPTMFGERVPVFTTHEDVLNTDLITRLRQADFGYWPAPTPDEHAALMSSPECDGVNTDLTKKYGAGTAYWFLLQGFNRACKEFGLEGVVFDHVDIAAQMHHPRPKGWRLAGMGCDPFVAFSMVTPDDPDLQPELQAA